MQEGEAVIGAGILVLLVALVVRLFRACATSQVRGFLDNDAPQKPRTFEYVKLPSR